MAKSLEDYFARGTRFPGGLPNPDRVSAGIDLSVHDDLTDVDEGVRRAAAALGRPVSAVDAEGYEIEIVAGCVTDDGRIAWVEVRSREEHGMVDVSFDLFVRGPEASWRWELASYNPYFGCHVGHIGFHDDAVVLVYHEKHQQLVARSTPAGTILVDIDTDWRVTDDAIVILSEREPELIEIVDLSTLRRQLPWPAARFDARVRIGARLAQPTDSTAYCRAVAQRLWGGDADRLEADVIVGALVHRFWDPRPPPRDSYPRDTRWNSPAWLPLDWARSSSGRRDATLALLDVARGSSIEWTATDDDARAVQAAAAYVRARAGPLADAIGGGERPDEAAYMWIEWSMKKLEPDLPRFPVGFRTAFETLRPDAKTLGAWR